MILTMESFWKWMIHSVVIKIFFARSSFVDLEMVTLPPRSLTHINKPTLNIYNPIRSKQEYTLSIDSYMSFLPMHTHTRADKEEHADVNVHKEQPFLSASKTIRLRLSHERENH
jgi:hypothetical protein